MEDFRILAVDDEQVILENIQDFLHEYNLEIESDPEKAKKRFEEAYFDIVLVDYKMPKVSGLDLLMEGKSRKAYRYGILVTAYADIPLLKEFLNHGLIKQFLEKPIRLPRLKEVVDEALLWCGEERNREKELERLRIQTETQPDLVIGKDTTLSHIYKDLSHLAVSGENILITGETGTGKEVIAREIHRMSGREEGPFVKINCGAIPESLIESELFGFKKGAFSGAYYDKKGRIELAHKGTLFLDEITELKTELQTRLLQVIQDKEVERIGDSKAIPVDFRLIAATNREPGELTNEEVFRQDLYFRISTLHINLPPLRERIEDIELFADFFLSRYAEELGKRPVRLTPEALSQLQTYQWPGNIRELENVLKRAVILLGANRSVIETEAFRFLNTGNRFLERTCPDENEAYLRVIDRLAEELIDNRLDLKTVETDIVKAVLRRFDYKVTEAAEHSGIQKDKLYKIKRLLL